MLTSVAGRRLLKDQLRQSLKTRIVLTHIVTEDFARAHLGLSPCQALLYDKETRIDTKCDEASSDSENEDHASEVQTVRFWFDYLGEPVSDRMFSQPDLLVDIHSVDPATKDTVRTVLKELKKRVYRDLASDHCLLVEEPTKAGTVQETDVIVRRTHAVERTLRNALSACRQILERNGLRDDVQVQLTTREELERIYQDLDLLVDESTSPRGTLYLNNHLTTSRRPKTGLLKLLKPVRSENRTENPDSSDDEFPDSEQVVSGSTVYYVLQPEVDVKEIVNRINADVRKGQ